MSTKQVVFAALFLAIVPLTGCGGGEDCPPQHISNEMPQALDRQTQTCLVMK